MRLLSRLAIGVAAATLAISPLSPSEASAAEPPPLAEAGNDTDIVWRPWSAWSYRAHPTSTQECAAAREKRGGYYPPGCRYKMRMRTGVPRLIRAATETQAAWYEGKAEYIIIGPYDDWRITPYVHFIYDGINVWKVTNACPYRSFWWVFDVTWCNVDNDGGARIGYMRSGADWHVDALFKGSVFSWGHWARVSVFVDGRVCCIEPAP